MTNYEKLQYLDRLRDTIYPSREELYRMAVMNSTELTEGQKRFFYSAINGGYKPLRFLGAGTFGRVFLCQDSHNNIFAVKLAEMGKEGERAACISELEISSRCKEKGVSCAIPYLNGTTSINKIKCAQLFSYQPVQFVMPVGLSYIDFIFQYIKKKDGRLSSSEVFFLIYNMFSIIKKIHECDIVHRDIKPQNMMLVVASSGKVQLMLSDFGTARTFEETGMYTQGIGSLPFIPLQLRKYQVRKMSKEDSKKQDVYATAITAYTILDRFESLEKNSKKHQVLVTYPNQLSKPVCCSDERLWDILKSVIYNSNNISRIPTAKEVCKALDKILFPSSETYQRPIQVQRKQPPTRVHDGERQTKLYFSNQPHGKKSNPASNKPKYGNQGGSTPTVGFKPKQTNPGYGSHQQSKNKTRVAYGGKPQGFKPKKGNGGSSAVNGYNGNGGAEPDIQDIINSLLK